MTATVDNRVVEMDFDNRKFESNVQTSIKTLDSLKKGLNLSTSAKNLNTLAEAGRNFSLGGIADGVRGISDRFTALGIVGMTVLQNLTTAVMNLGQRMLNTVVLGPLKQGFSEYETQMNAIQTVLANTQSKGTTLDQVNEALNQLNTYSDKTIYNFTEMARNIGTFTAAGVSLETSTSAIKGIANLAAVSGSNSQQAAVAMYQLSQALSSGTVRLMDWNSVVNAGMGGQVFQDALKETARVHDIAIDDMVKQEGSFRETLQKGWLTSEILTETLSKFTGDLSEAQLETMGYTKEQIAEIIKLGQTANDAATKVKTFSQLSQTLMEALQSGWAKTWQIIIGDFEEAKSFMTEVSDMFGELINESSDARNGLLKAWKDMGGRSSVIRTLRNTLEGIRSILKPISDGFKEIIPPATRGQLFIFTRAIEELSEKFKIGDDTAAKLKETFKGVASIFSIVFMLASAVARGLSRLAVLIIPKLSGGLLDMTASAGTWLTTLRKTIEVNDTFNKAIDKIAIFLGRARDAVINFSSIVRSEFEAVKLKLSSVFKNVDTSGLDKFADELKTRFKPLTTLGKIVSKIIEVIGNVLVRIAPWFFKLATLAGEAFAKIGDFIFNNIGNIDFSKVFDIINGGLLSALILAIKKFVEKGSGVFDGVVGILDSVKGSLMAWQQSLKADTLLKIASAMGILTISIIALSMVDSEKMTLALGALTVMFAELFGTVAIFDKLSGGPGLKMIDKSAVTMFAIAISVSILAGAVKKLGSLDTAQITQGLIAIEILLASILGFSLVLSKNASSITKGTSGLILFAISLSIMAGVVKKLGEMDVDVLKQGLISIGVLFAELSVFVASMGNAKSLIGVSVSLVIIATSMLIFAGAVQKLGQIPVNEIVNGLVAMAGIFAIIIASVNLMPKNMILTSVSLLIVAGALSILANALVTLGGMTWEEIGRGLAVLAGAMIILGVAMYAMTGALPGAAAMFIMAAAIAILTPALKSLGSMSLAEIGKSLLMLVGVFVVIGVAGLVLAPLVPVLLALGAAMLLLGLATMAVGVGILAFSAGLAALAVTGAAGGAVLVTVISGLAALIPYVVAKIGEGLLVLLNTLITAIPTFLLLVETLLLGLVALIVKVTPIVVTAILNLLTQLLQGIAASLPAIIQAGYDILLAILTGISNNIGGIVEAAIQIVVNFIGAIANKLPDIIEAGWDLIISFIDGLTASVEDNTATLMISVTKLGVAIVEGVAKGITGSFKLVLEAVKKLGAYIVSKLKDILGIKSPSTEGVSIGMFLVEGLANGITNSFGFVSRAVDEFGNKTISNLSQTIQKISSMVNDEMNLNPSIRPVMDLSDIVDGNKRLTNLLADKNLNLAMASSISNGFAMRNNQPINSVTPQVNSTNVELIQNNYSPKELSRIDIYRQTQNQLIMLKGVLNN